MSALSLKDIQRIFDEVKSEVNAPNKAFVDRYDRAMEHKKVKDWKMVIEILTPSVDPPSIYHGHYGQLFIAYRAIYREEIKNGRFKTVIEIIERMRRLDKEMLEAMTVYWSEQHNKAYPANHFQSYSKINVTDLKTYSKALVKASWGN